MSRSVLALLAATLTAVLLTACTSDVDVPEGASAGSCDPALDTAFRSWGNAGFSGVVVVDRVHGPACATGVGLADHATGTINTADTVYAIGSISKTFTAAAILQLEADGKLRRSDRAGTLLPGLGGPVADATVGQLLLHTSGLTGSHGQDHQALERAAAIRALSGLRIDAARTGTFLYSNAGFSLLALIVDELSPSGYRDFLASRILTTGGGFWDGAPAAPGPRAVGRSEDASTRGFAGPHWALAGNGDLAMTMPALAAWTRALFAGDVVAPTALAALLDPAAEDDNGRPLSPGWVHVDAATFGEPLYATAGGGGDLGQDVVLAWLPDSERVIAFASNSADLTAEELLAKLAPALVKGEPLPTPRAAGPAAGDAGLAGLTGTYRTPEGALVVETVDGELLVRAQGREAITALMPTLGHDAAEVAAHESAVRDLLAGRTEAGREELALIAQDAGAVTGSEILGSVVDEGELRTYVRLKVAGKALIGWYALSRSGGVEGADLGGEHPTVRLLAAASGYRVAGAQEVTVSFAGSRITVTGPGGTVTGERS